MTEQIEQQPQTEQIQEKQEVKTTEVEDQFGLTDILKILEQPQKVQEIAGNQKEVFVFLFL